MHHASRFGDEFFSMAEFILNPIWINAAEKQNSRTWAAKVRRGWPAKPAWAAPSSSAVVGRSLVDHVCDPTVVRGNQNDSVIAFLDEK